VQRATLKNHAGIFAISPEGQSGNIAQLRGIIFEYWSRLTVNIYFVISRNKCNRSLSLSMMQQHRIRIDLPNTVVGPNYRQKHGSMVFIWFPGNMDHMMPCSPGTWRCTDETGQHCLFLHITWCALDQSRSRNSDGDITVCVVWVCRTIWNFTYLCLRARMNEWIHIMWYCEL